jgi:hypothetical protein
MRVKSTFMNVHYQHSSNNNNNNTLQVEGNTMRLRRHDILTLLLYTTTQCMFLEDMMEVTAQTFMNLTLSNPRGDQFLEAVDLQGLGIVLPLVSMRI